MMHESITFVEHLRNTLHSVMENDPEIIVIGEDISDPYGGAFKVTKGLSTRFPERVINTPICEASIVGISVGLALRGIRPVAELMFSDFITLAADQIINHAAKFHAMYNGAVTVPMVVRLPSGGRRGYGPTHSQSLERLFLGIPNIKVVAPSHFHDVGAILRKAIYDLEPVIFVENKTLYPLQLLLSKQIGGLERAVINNELGYPDVIIRNYKQPMRPDVTIIGYGGVSHLLGPLLERLIEEEIWVLACLPSCLSPIVDKSIVDAAALTGRVLIVEEGQSEFGWGGEMAARLYKLLSNHNCRIERLGMDSTIIPASTTLEEEIFISENDISAAIMKVLK